MLEALVVTSSLSALVLLSLSQQRSPRWMIFCDENDKDRDQVRNVKLDVTQLPMSRVICKIDEQVVGMHMRRIYVVSGS